MSNGGILRQMRCSLVIFAFFYCVRAFKSPYAFRFRVLREVFMSQNNEANATQSTPVFTPSVPNSFKTSLSGWSNSDVSRGIIPIGPEGLADVSTSLATPSGLRSEESLRYYNIMSNLAPHDLIMKFAKSAPKNVQEATKTTIMNLLGSMPNYALDAALVTTNTKLANLLYQMQITGYMFKNAEYCMSLTRSLKGLPKLPAAAEIKKNDVVLNPRQEGMTFQGEVTVQTTSGETVKISVQELTGALSKEVDDLRRELATIKNERENELKSNLLTYIQALPEKELGRLTSDMSEDVVQAIQLLVNAVMEKLGLESNAPEVIIQQSVANLAQLCMWQMVMGYKLRELEALDRGVSLD